MDKSKRVVIKNSISLYAMTFVRMVFPLLTLPYLTRVLSKDAFGTMSYVNASMSYIQMVIDFGYILSATALIASAKEDKDKQGQIIGNTIASKLILSGISFVVMVIMCMSIGLLRENLAYTFLMFIASMISIFLLDFYFQGIEEMHLLTIRFMIMQTISTALTFLLVHDDGDLLWIPVLNIIATSVAACLSVWQIVVRSHIRITVSGITDVLASIKNSFIYWLSDVSSTAFTALNTLLIGIYMSKVDVALWSISLQVVIVIQRLYSPITNSIYPYMVRSPQFKLIRKILIIFMPLVLSGCCLLWMLAPWIMHVLGGGSKYLDATPILRALTPLLFVSFPNLLFGWPVLGAIQRVKETTGTTIASAVVQVIMLALLIVNGLFSPIMIALSRAVSETFMLILRLFYTHKYRADFMDSVSSEEAS